MSRERFCTIVGRLLTIQNRVSFAKLLYWSIVDKTLNMRHTNTTMNLKKERHFYNTIEIGQSSVSRCQVSSARASRALKMRTFYVKGGYGESRFFAQICPMLPLRSFKRAVCRKSTELSDMSRCARTRAKLCHTECSVTLRLGYPDCSSRTRNRFLPRTRNAGHNH